jgi:chromosome segregation ATPase
MSSPPSSSPEKLTAATTRVADARSALRRAEAGHEKLRHKRAATEAELKRLETKAAEIQTALESAKATLAADEKHLEAWAGTLAFATADLRVAERSMAVAEAESRLARFHSEHPEGAPGSERKKLEQAVDLAAEQLVEEKAELDYDGLSRKAKEAARTLEAIRISEADRNKLAAIELKLAQLTAVADRKKQEEAALAGRQKKSAQDLAALDSERKKLEAERKRLAGKP